MHLARAAVMTVLVLQTPALAPLAAGQQASTPAPTGDMSKPIPGVDLTALDRSVPACQDFYAFACGGWLKPNTIPPDRPEWSRFSELADRNLAVLRGILEDASQPGGSNPAYVRQAGDYYAACMDEPAIDARGLEPLSSELARIDALADRSQLPELIAHLQTLGASAFADLGSLPDPDNPAVAVAIVSQGGLGLPERGYYVRTDERSEGLRKAYVAHVQRMLALSGLADADAGPAAAAVLALETDLAKASLDVVALRDPQQFKNKKPVADLQGLTPAFEWSKYLTAIGAPAFSTVDVVPAQFFPAMNAAIATRPVAEIKAYLRWHLVHALVPALPAAFVNENFEFYGKTLQGSKALRPRWKRCVAQVDSSLGEALGRAYVEREFAGESKVRALETANAIVESMRLDIQQIDWMTQATKDQALAKLARVVEKIGYPAKWRDYSSVVVRRDDPLGNLRRATAFEVHRQLAKIGQPVDKAEWMMTPTTVNAGYDPTTNQITFPAAVLQWPFFLATRDDAMNLGSIGWAFGHELTHGFDDEGRQFGAGGELRDWWTPADASAYEERAQCFVEEYNAFPAAGDLKVNGKLTLGENIADNGGLRLAYAALQRSEASKPLGNLDGFTADQRFFLSSAQVWCSLMRPEFERLIVQTDPHSPSKYRVNGTVSNMPEFQKAFSCPADAPMVRRPPCRVW